MKHPENKLRRRVDDDDDSTKQLQKKISHAADPSFFINLLG